MGQNSTYVRQLKKSKYLNNLIYILHLNSYHLPGARHRHLALTGLYVRRPDVIRFVSIHSIRFIRFDSFDSFIFKTLFKKKAKSKASKGKHSASMNFHPAANEMRKRTTIVFICFLLVALVGFLFLLVVVWMNGSSLSCLLLPPLLSFQTPCYYIYIYKSSTKKLHNFRLYFQNQRPK